MHPRRPSAATLIALLALFLALAIAGCGSSTHRQSSLFNMETLGASITQKLDSTPGAGHVTGATCIHTGETTADCSLSYPASARSSEEGPESIEVNIASNGQSWSIK